MTRPPSRPSPLLAAAGLAAILLALLAPSGARAGAGENVLNIYNWSDYIGEDTVRQFEKETGIKVNYDTFDANETVHTKLRAGHTGYDIVVPSSHWAHRQIEGGLLAELEPSKIPTWRNLDPWLMAGIATMDPGNRHLAPWLWGITTVGINVDKVNAALGTMPMPADAWDLLFDPAYASRLSSCGLSVLDTADDVFPAALHFLGLPPFSRKRSDYDAAAKLLARLRPHVTLFSSSGYINSLADGSLCVVMGWNGDIAIASERARRAGNGQRIEALVPRSGGVMFFDTMAIPVDAPHVENAYKWIAFIYRPEVQAGIIDKVPYGSPVRASERLLSPETRAIKGVFLDEATRARITPPDALPFEILRHRTRLFTTFKSGL